MRLYKYDELHPKAQEKLISGQASQELSDEARQTIIEDLRSEGHMFLVTGMWGCIIPAAVQAERLAKLNNGTSGHGFDKVLHMCWEWQSGYNPTIEQALGEENADRWSDE